jgi:CTD kinase subunit beta
MVESERQRLLTIERLILETICFNFTSRMAFPYVIKIGRVLKASKRLTKFAWRIATDWYAPAVVHRGTWVLTDRQP